MRAAFLSGVYVCLCLYAGVGLGFVTYPTGQPTARPTALPTAQPSSAPTAVREKELRPACVALPL